MILKLYKHCTAQQQQQRRLCHVNNNKSRSIDFFFVLSIPSIQHRVEMDRVNE